MFLCWADRCGPPFCNVRCCHKQKRAFCGEGTPKFNLPLLPVDVVRTASHVVAHGIIRVSSVLFVLLDRPVPLTRSVLRGHVYAD
jgi:hypothetical protein